MTDKDDRLVERLQGLNVDASALEGDPFSKRSNWRSTLLASGRGWIAAAIAIGVLVMGWRFSAPVSQQVTQTASAGAVTQLLAENPPVLKQQIVDDLRAAGVEAIGYDRLGLSGVDAAVPGPAPAAVRAVLEKHGIPAPADGIVRVEIRAPARKVSPAG
jgi:hypothetical protein